MVLRFGPSSPRQPRPVSATAHQTRAMRPVEQIGKSASGFSERPSPNGSWNPILKLRLQRARHGNEQCRRNLLR